MSAGVLGRRTLGREHNASPSAAQSDRLLDVNEAAELLAVSPATLYTWASDRRIPTVKLGRALRFRLSTLRKLIAKSERPALP
jgi:excisionase family DNA binding protein